MSKTRRELKKLGTVFNPRASNEWSKNDSKFGQRMLEKMGWMKGQGLGVSNQGITENVKLPLKLDTKGLGFRFKDDEWVQVEHGFSAVLTQLNQQSDCEIIQKEKQNSLVSKSSSFKSRIHYHKFTRGKDVSRYNAKDLAGILGQKLETQEDDSLYNSSNCLNNSFQVLDNEVNSEASVISKTKKLEKPKDDSKALLPDMNVSKTKKRKKRKNDSTCISIEEIEKSDSKNYTNNNGDRISKMVDDTETLKTNLGAETINCKLRKRKHILKIGENVEIFDTCDSTKHLNSKKRKTIQHHSEGLAKCSDSASFLPVSKMKNLNAMMEKSKQSDHNVEEEISKDSAAVIEVITDKKFTITDQYEAESVTRDIVENHLKPTKTKRKKNLVQDSATEIIDSANYALFDSQSCEITNDECSEKLKRRHISKIIDNPTILSQSTEKNRKVDVSVTDCCEEPSEHEQNNSKKSSWKSKHEKSCRKTVSNTNESSESSEHSNTYNMSVAENEVAEFNNELNRNCETSHQPRKLTQAELLVIKIRLLKRLQNEKIPHGFNGSNLFSIQGYGDSPKT